MSSADVPLHRSYLYAPGSRPEVLPKAAAAGADAVVLDLEDSVAPTAKVRARDSVRAFLREAPPTRRSGPELHVRVNRDGEGWDRADVDAVILPSLAALRLPKSEHPDALRRLDDFLGVREADLGIPVGSIGLYPTIESALGATRVRALALASSRVVRFVFGASDLLADLGAVGDDDLATLYLRSQLVVESRVVGVGPPVDSVHTDIGDGEGLALAARRARSLGFHGKSLIHPRQIAVVHEAFRPTVAEVAAARRIVVEASNAAGEGQGGITVDGAFVDPAIVARARAVLRLTELP